MRRTFILMIAFLFLLAGCGPKETVAPAPSPSGMTTPTPTATPTPTPTPTPEPTEEVKELWGFPIDETHDAFEVPTGGKLGTVLVTVERGKENTESEFGGYHYTLSIWDKSDLTTPIQTFEEVEPIFTGSDAVSLNDANFDGYMDVMIRWDSMAMNWPFSLYTWNEEQGRFAFGASFVGRWVSVDQERKTLENYIHTSGVSEIHKIFRWEDGEPVCVREVELCYPEDVEDGRTEQDLVVRDLMDGELTEVYRRTAVWTEDGSPLFDEMLRWEDPDYHGSWGFPIDDAHDAFTVPTGGKLGTVMVTVEKMEDDSEEEYEFQFSVWTADDLKNPIQTMKVEGWSPLGGDEMVDANFDGYMDFGYQYSWGTGGIFHHYWVWDEATGRFEAVPELSQFGDIVFEKGTQTVRGHMRHGYAGLWADDYIYRWNSKKLICVRMIELYPREDVDDGTKVEVTVSDRIDGTLTEVFSTEVTVEAERLWDEIDKWYDLNYHGEEGAG